MIALPIFLSCMRRQNAEPACRNENAFCRKGNLKANLPDRAAFRPFHSGTHVSIPNSPKPANAFFPPFLARNS